MFASSRRHLGRSGRLGCAALAVMLGTGLVSPGAAPAGATTTTDPGLLAQTRSEPSFSPQLSDQLRTLWTAIIHDNVGLAGRVFFPRTAYLRMKSGQIANPASDYASRLRALYALDVAAYHRQVSLSGAVKLVAVHYDATFATWITPGACENSIGYWHLPGVRLVFAHGTRRWSVAVASLISWHGTWYVVHLGPNPRARDVGTVDDFRSGPGVPGPAGGC